MTAATTSCASAIDANLLRRVSNGDAGAWDDIVRRYGKLVSAAVRSFGMQDADALDAVQTTWLRLAENVHQVQFPERLGGWLATTARRECLRILRQATSGTELGNSVPETVADHSIGPEQRVIDAATTRMLWNIVAELSPRQRTLVQELFTGHPRPYAEVARATGIPVGGVGPTRARALRHIRGRLNDNGLGPDTWR